MRLETLLILIRMLESKTVELENGVTFVVETKEFVKEVGGKTFKSASYNGVIKQADQYEEVLDERTINTDRYIEVMAVGSTDKTILLFDPESRKMFDRNTLERLSPMGFKWCKVEDHEEVMSLYRSRNRYSDKLDTIQEQINEVESSIKNLLIDPKHLSGRNRVSY